MGLTSVDFTLQDRKSVVNSMLDVHFIEIKCWFADRLTCLVTRISFFGLSVFSCEAANFRRQTGEIKNLR